MSEKRLRGVDDNGGQEEQLAFSNHVQADTKLTGQADDFVVERVGEDGLWQVSVVVGGQVAVRGCKAGQSVKLSGIVAANIPEKSLDQYGGQMHIVVLVKINRLAPVNLVFGLAHGVGIGRSAEDSFHIQAYARQQRWRGRGREEQQELSSSC